MDDGTYANPDIVSYLNSNYICIKVDKNLHPQVDHILSTTVQAMIGTSNWPLTVILTPDLKPFVGAGFLPPDRFMNALTNINNKWINARSEVVTEADRVFHALHEYSKMDTSIRIDKTESSEWIDLVFDAIVNGVGECERSFDSEFGGFHGNEKSQESFKFIRPGTLQMLMLIGYGLKLNEVSSRARVMLNKTVESILDRALFDHVEGGFFRAVNPSFELPIFEKSIVDQAQLTAMLCDISRNLEESEDGNARSELQHRIRESVERTMDYCMSELRSLNGLFVVGQDSDSALPYGGDAGQIQEGAYYVFPQWEIQLVCGGDHSMEYKCLQMVYGVSMDGNMKGEIGSLYEGANLLYRIKSNAHVANLLQIESSQVEEYATRARNRLKECRRSRPKPVLDTLTLTSANGMMVCALMKAASLVPSRRKEYCKGAELVAELIWKNAVVIDPNNSVNVLDIARVIYEDGVDSELEWVPGIGEDCAWIVSAFLDLYESEVDDGDIAQKSVWLSRAIQVQTYLDRKYFSDSLGGYLWGDQSDKTLFVMGKRCYDSEEPCVTSQTALNLIRLHSISNDALYLKRFEKIMISHGKVLLKATLSMPSLLSAAIVSLDKHELETRINADTQ
eukprot:CAMPEP_0182443544 /NCGR_PEP_ID=MMETSP1172-20130603/2254_1 /TAXON_ID=708627 /ORGANISM="Timspurckia oligopyrenoides, Strain CCMP3278" /LENGTH=620 /DNA_ID=CAMNT_0024638861 /DNA_START=299 /DNA_END=2161 /DNA_ORIENTATION=+